MGYRCECVVDELLLGRQSIAERQVIRGRRAPDAARPALTGLTPVVHRSLPIFGRASSVVPVESRNVESRAPSFKTPFASGGYARRRDASARAVD